MTQLRSKALGAPGAYGLNTQTNPIDLPAQFGTVALNAFVDESGRLAARKSAARVTSDNSDLVTTNPIKRVYRHNKADGNSIFFCSGNNRIFSASASTLTSRSSGHSADLWQFASLNGKLFAAQAAHSLRWFDETTFAETTQATPSNPKAILSAYGRLWSISSDGWTLAWSDLLDGTNFTTGASGSLGLQQMHTGFRDPAIAVAAFGRNIVAFGRNSVMILGLSNDCNPNDVTTPIYLQDFIPNIGCIARDTVVTTGDDVLFVADDGLRSLSRSLQEKQGPAPMTESTALNKDRFINDVIGGSTAANLAACWHPKESWYQLFVPDTYEVWNFDLSLRVPQTQYPRTTVWTMGSSKKLYHGTYWTDNVVYYGMIGGLGTMASYDSTTTYTFSIATGWLSLDAPEALKHFKKMLMNVRGGGGQTGVLKWFVDFNESDFTSATFALASNSTAAEYGIAEYNIDEYSVGEIVADIYVHLKNSAKFVKFLIEIPVVGTVISVNNMNVFYNQGRVR